MGQKEHVISVKTLRNLFDVCSRKKFEAQNNKKIMVYIQLKKHLLNSFLITRHCARLQNIKDKGEVD